MEPYFLRISRSTYPLSALSYLTHGPRGQGYGVYVSVGGRPPCAIVECRSESEAITLEEAILHEIAATIQEHQRLADPRIPACIIDLDQVAADNLAEIRTEARLEGLDVVPEPDFCPHKDRCPGSDCCEVGDRCLRAAARGRS